MLANLVTFAHLSVSSRTNFVNSAVDMISGSSPRPTSFSFAAGSAIMALVVLASLSMMSAGGAVGGVERSHPTPAHPLERPTGDIRTAAIAGRRHVDLAGIGLGVGNELREAPGRQRRRRDQ